MLHELQRHLRELVGREREHAALLDLVLEQRLHTSAIAAQQIEHKPTQGVDLGAFFRAEDWADDALERFETDPRIGVERAIGTAHELGLGVLVVLIVDIADDLLKDHPVTEDVKEKARSEGSSDEDLEQLSWNPYTFPQAAVRASCMSPELTDEDVTEIFEGDSWNAVEITALFLGALQANTTRRVVELGKD